MSEPNKYSAFFGDNGTPNKTDIKTHSEADNSGGDDVERWVSILRKAEPNHWAWKDSQQTKRVTDDLRMALSAKGTTPDQDSLMRQESPDVPEEEDDWAARTAKSMQRQNPQWVMWSDPQKRQEFIQGLRDENPLARRGGPVKQRPQDPEEEPFSSDKFWSNRDELQQVAKRVRPPKL